MLTREQQNELDRLEARHRRGQRQELDRLEARYRKTKGRTAVRRPEPVKQPDIHVHVTTPEQNTPPITKPDPIIMPSPRKWLFEHRYDEHGRLVKTTATAQ